MYLFFLCGTQSRPILSENYSWAVFLRKCKACEKTCEEEKKGMNTGAQTRIKKFTTTTTTHENCLFAREKARWEGCNESFLKEENRSVLRRFVVVREQKNGIQLRWWHFTFTQNILAMLLTIISSLLKGKKLSHRQQYNDMRYNAPKICSFLFV